MLWLFAESSLSIGRAEYREQQAGRNIQKRFNLSKSLKYLNLNLNSISKIEKNTFDQLIKLEKLFISCNSLTSSMLDSNPFLFKYLFNLRELNLSSNSIEYLSPNLFYNLNKLTTIDLSSNSIRFIHNYAFNKLSSLKNLHLKNNSHLLTFESYKSFNELNSINNIYISKAILDANEFNKCFFKQLFITNNPRFYNNDKNSTRDGLILSRNG